jgi:hypothetical protein
MPSVARLPNGQSGNSDGVPPADIYKAAIEEYRWQAQFNWTRTQYTLVFNTAILAAATAVASHGGRSAVLVYGLGVVAAVVSALVVRTQHDYYRAARDRMKRVEEDLAIPPDHRTNTTSTLGHRRRTASVTQLVYLLLGAMCVADVTGAVIVLTR